MAWWARGSGGPKKCALTLEAGAGKTSIARPSLGISWRRRRSGNSPTPRLVSEYRFLALTQNPLALARLESSPLLPSATETKSEFWRPDNRKRSPPDLGGGRWEAVARNL